MPVARLALVQRLPVFAATSSEHCHYRAVQSVLHQGRGRCNIEGTTREVANRGHRQRAGKVVRLDLKGALPIVRKSLFSTEDWDKITAMRAAGESFRTIAQALQVSLGTMLCQWRHMRTKPERSPDRTATSAERLHMISLRNDQMLRLAQIAIRTGRSTTVVRRALRSPLNTERKPLEKPARPYTQAQDGEIIRLREQDGLTYAQIAARMQERSAKGVQHRYYGYLRDRGATRKVNNSLSYTKVEAGELIRLRKHGRLSFAQIVELFPGRNAMALNDKHLHLTKGRK
ncbi:hypothetical protein LTR12_015894 [Friedmanniomyces endolithicus]|nr:hypothetical protein LTR12_015894 [Friedmanniomyces endolithicus]